MQFLIDDDPSIAVETEWSEIQKYAQEHTTPDEETYILFKALEKNKEFEKEIIKSRIRMGIPPEGFSWKEYQKFHNVKRNVNPKEIDVYLNFIRSYPKEIERIRRKMKLNLMIERQLHDILMGNFIQPYFRGLGYAPDIELDEDLDEVPNGDVESVTIHISKKIKKNELIKFIEESWSGIERYILKFPEEGRFFISVRDLRIIELRDDFKLKYKDIADQIIKEFNILNVDGNINEDSIKTAYKRAKQKISSLAYKRGNKNLA